MPIQRVPRYKLLLAELLKNMEKEDNEKEYEEMAKVLELIAKVATEINDNIKLQEQHAVLLRLQGQLTGLDIPLVAPARRFGRVVA